MKEQLKISHVTPDEFSDQVADKVDPQLSGATSIEKTTQSSQEDILFKSLKHAANYYGVCYQTMSKLLNKIPHYALGRSIKIYRSDIERSLRKDGIFSKRERRRK